MGIHLFTGFEMSCFVDGTTSTFSKESPSDEKSSSVSFSELRDEAETDVSYMSNQSAFEDAFPYNQGVVARPSKESDQPVQCQFLLGMAPKNIVHYGSGTRHASTMQGGCYRVVVPPWSAGRWHAISTSEPRTHGRKPRKATIRQFVQCGSLDYCECSFGVRSRMPHNHLRDNLPFVFIKAQTTTGPGGTQNPGSRLWMRSEVAPANYSLDYGGAAENTERPRPVAAAVRRSR
ncbi:hypothetical protein HPB50_028431 [Hyalomma asiaticum]|nr:hypothetical protein HPB50_028431 [Hyalomma asiaticum]